MAQDDNLTVDDSIQLRQISPTEAPLDLLLLADPSEIKIQGYLPTSKCFAAYSEGIVAGVCVVKPIAGNTYELMNIAIAPSRQQAGIGTKLLQYVIAQMERAGAHRLEVGTEPLVINWHFISGRGLE